ncbi:MAG: ribokinase [Maritimibacter sp.]
MSVYNFGSINVDRFYQVPHLPRPGETLSATGHETGLGGKGANQSVAAAKAGATVRHIGMVGPDGAEMRWHLGQLGVDVTHVGSDGSVTGHANICVDPQGENAIVVFPGANREQSLTRLETALAEAKPGDFFLLQNEVNMHQEAAKLARDRGLFVVYSAAPFRAELARDMLPLTDLLVLNEGEAEQLSDVLGLPLDNIPVPNVLVTRGARGAVWHDQTNGSVTEVAAVPVDPIDTTGAGDCFIGYVVAGLDQGFSREQALGLGAAAAALQVTRSGTADAMPGRDEVDKFLGEIETA